MIQGLDFIIFPVIGAAIGAFTNQVAIKMLFRPYQAIYLGKWRLPFTPGLIPSQRHVIAHNIATAFETNLLSGDEIHQAVTSPRAQQIIEEQVDAFWEQLGPFAAMMARMKPQVVKRIIATVDALATDAIAHGGELNIKQRLEDKINAMSISELEMLVLGFSRQQFRYITVFGGILGGLIGLVQAALSLVI